MSALYYGPHHKQVIGKFSPQRHLGIKTCVRVCVCVWRPCSVWNWM